ncbi:MAG: hypothetical protein N3E51_05290, partial [Candidatus Micrarchaeota archaeon]|nr:hypothetical protein [Candidatus Micrarchaeota archaeon]
LEENKQRMGMGIVGLAGKAWRYWRLHSAAHPIERERYHPVSRLIYDFIVQKFRALLFSRFFFKKADLSQPFFYFPLHFEQDAQLTTREPFVEQVQLIRSISFCLPARVKLYVKSHPHYLASDMEYRRIREISRLPNVVLIDPAAYSTEIVKHALGVITVNSTVGFEAMVLDRPVITFGHDFYAIPGACIVLRDMADLPRVLFGVMKNPHYGIDPHIRKRFVGLYFCNIIQLEGRLRWGGFEFTRKDYRNIAAMIQAALKTPEMPYGLPAGTGKKK